MNKRIAQNDRGNALVTTYVCQTCFFRCESVRCYSGTIILPRNRMLPVVL